MAPAASRSDGGGVNGAGERRGRVVVCSLEGSRYDANAVEVAFQLAHVAEARLALVAVAPIADADERRDRSPWTPEEARRALETAAASLDGDLGVDCVLEIGHPMRRLLEFARASDALLLVVGAGGEAAGRPPSIVARGLAKSAPCPVVVVPETAAVPALARRAED
jgi:nucleotide-binding universal stress UspA family protein